jgi:hypothetical protein
MKLVFRLAVLVAAIIARAFPALFPGWHTITSRSVRAAYGANPAR